MKVDSRIFIWALKRQQFNAQKCYAGINSMDFKWSLQVLFGFASAFLFLFLFFKWGCFWFRNWISGLHFTKVHLKLHALKSNEGKKGGLLHHTYFSFSSLFSSVSILITNLCHCSKKDIQYVTEEWLVRLRQPLVKWKVKAVTALLIVLGLRLWLTTELGRLTRSMGCGECKI